MGFHLPLNTLSSRTRTIRLFFGFMARRKGSYKGHKWTEEELNLVCYLRYIRHWRFTQIQRAKFPLLSRHSVGGAYRSIPPQERTHRALAAVPVNTRPRNITESQSQPSFSNTIPRHSHHSTANNETRDTTLDTNGDNPNRYNLRPNRPSIFAERKPRYMVDRDRFSHFFESYRSSLKPNEPLDSEYIPPSHTPTPSSSEYSLSISSSPPSEISSLELFGLQARSPEPSNHTPSVLSVCSSGSSSAEFFSTEEP
jgi:hypothetical protein